MPVYAVNPGDLRTRITFQQPTIVVDAGGAQTTSWANVSTNPTVWARWVYEHGVEVLQNEAAKSVQRAIVTLRYRTDILPTWRLLMDSLAWSIISIDFVQDRNRWVEIIVERAKGTL